ncbi:hypothetical protein EDC01DRAFT_404025 [Geopyxis carbonaria]|nr:hypothetical protein EDC01DRAFT_404025 [Geopyxis carbonaria]
MAAFLVVGGMGLVLLNSFSTRSGERSPVLGRSGMRCSGGAPFPLGDRHAGTRWKERLAAGCPVVLRLGPGWQGEGTVGAVLLGRRVGSGTVMLPKQCGVGMSPLHPTPLSPQMHSVLRVMI